MIKNCSRWYDECPFGTKIIKVVCSFSCHRASSVAMGVKGVIPLRGINPFTPGRGISPNDMHWKRCFFKGLITKCCKCSDGSFL